ncbi:MAG: asparagine synthase (glutamine-hydrolyzing) [Rhodospirillaceae bacterium]|nr:asparagine synthase (glutamine-hydrolyzing) [Rhodospirillaceae bacterium]|tara:strand:- start:8396 stop:10141 length:1746 start_codon:yes stop_codon:yes gene_type:complete
MCGIAGYYTSNKGFNGSNLLKSLEGSLYHRGPDQNGTYQNSQVGFVHTRLSIIDISNGRQPFCADGVALIANAEIYNYKELIRNNSEYSYSSSSDCEVIIPLYQKYGLKFSDHLRGMYSVALYDENEDKLIISRDPFGIKPLYYIINESGFYFASEIKALCEAEIIDKKIDNNVLKELLAHQYSLDSNTIISGIKRVLPGETIIIKKGKIEKKFLNNPLKKIGNKNKSDKGFLKKLDSALYDSVSKHLRADVPLGLFLSGGIDSTVLLIIMSELLDKPVNSYTAYFDIASNFERDHSSYLASKYKSNHIELKVDKDNFINDLPRVIKALDDPVADYAVLPTFLLAERASKDLKVILCGEGGDELFAGYGRYRKILRPLLFNNNNLQKKSIFAKKGILRDKFLNPKNYNVLFENYSCLTKLQNAQLFDTKYWLPNDLLNKVDRCLMYHGLEGRTPYLDNIIFENSFNLPDKLKIRQGRGKYILRKWLSHKDKSAKAFQRKSGFTVPVVDWIFQEGEMLGPLVAQQECIKDIAYPSSVRSIFMKKTKKSSLAAWVLLFYSLWYKIHIIDKKTEGTIFDVLSNN